MWDNAPLLRGMANLLFGVSLVLALYGVVRYVLSLPVFPLRAVELTAAPKHVSLEQLEKTVHEQVQGNFVTVDLDRTRKAFEQLPWVRKVSVRRKFPWTLQVDVEEHVALARWNGVALVNTLGEVYTAQTDETLPVFIGQPDTSQQVAQMYEELNQVLLPMQQKIAQIAYSPRYAWQIRLDTGMELELGREDVQKRLSRFVSVYPYSLALNESAVRRVDLRYRHGFASYAAGGAT